MGSKIRDGMASNDIDEIKTTINNVIDLESVVKKNARQKEKLANEKGDLRDITESIIRKRTNDNGSGNVHRLSDEQKRKIRVLYHHINVLILNPSHDRTSMVEALKQFQNVFIDNSDEEEGMDFDDLENSQSNTITEKGNNFVYFKCNISC